VPAIDNRCRAWNARRMRCIALSAVLLFSFTASSADAETAATPVNLITLNPVRYGLEHYQLEYERVTSPRLSLFVSPILFHHSTSYGWGFFNHAPDATADGFGLDFGGRYFFSGSAPEGLFVGPFLSAYRGSLTRVGTTISGYVFSPGFQAGYTWLFRGWLVLSAGGGLGYGLATASAPPGSPHGSGLPHSGMWVNFRTNIGVAF